MGVNPDIHPRDFPKHWLRSVQFVHISTMSPHQQAEFISFIRQEAPQAKISLDTDHYFFDRPKLIEEIKQNFSQVDIAFANRHEYTLLKDTIHSLPKAVVKFDKEGARYLENGKEFFRLPAPKSEVIDATGAGDMLAGTYVSLNLKL